MPLFIPGFLEGVTIGVGEVEITEGGAGVPSHIAVAGSKHTNAAGIEYRNTDGTGTGWEAYLTETQITAILNTDSWFDPAIARDNTLYANVAAAEAAANVGDTVDGVTIVVGNIVFLDNLTAGQEGSYLVSGGTGAWTFTVTTESATPADGDTIQVTQGTSAGTWFYYNGATSAWVETPATLAAIQTELANLRAFVGKTAAGVELPTFTAGQVIANPTTTDLEQAVDELNVSLAGVIASGGGTVTTTLGVTTATIVASILVDSAAKVEYEFFIQEAGTPANTIVGTVMLQNDGRAAADATAIASQIGLTKTTGAAIAGLNFTRALSGVGAAQVMTISLTATNAIDVRVVAQAVIAPF